MERRQGEGAGALESIVADRGRRQQLEIVIAELASDEHAPSAIRDRRQIADRHIADSLAALQVPALRRARSIVDIGSGAGFPGIPIAVALPEVAVALVEARAVRCRFLARLARKARIENISVHCARVESWSWERGCCDAALARALAAQPVVLEYAAPLLAVGGVLVDWRGPAVAGSEAGERAAQQLGMARVERIAYRTGEQGPQLHLEVFEKVAPTPERFPRRPGVAAKHPLGSA
jgi:16S rRNA (guanine527-N7)-methyltransferase